MAEKGISIYYYLNNERYAYRHERFAVPRVGDEVRFNGICYKVMFVLWMEDQKPDYNNHVAIEIVPRENANG